jgi:CubicO group peptidase (beta-lactamase class C family)
MKRFFLQILFAFVLCFLPLQSVAAELDLAPYAEAFLKDSGAPGVTVAVLEKGQTLPLSVSLGTACLGQNVAMHDGMVMKLGSVTKLFTAVRILMLIEEGKITYDTPMSKFFPNFPRGDEILVRHLMAHTSGLPEMLRLEPFHSNMCKAWTPSELLKMVAAAPLDFAPGTTQKYSNSGYLVLGMMIEALTGESYQQQIKDKIATPLGMSRLQAGDDTTIVKDESCGYSNDASGQLCKPMLASLIPPLATGNLIGRAADIVRMVNLPGLLKENFIDNPPSSPHILDNGKPAQTEVHILDLNYLVSYHKGFATFRFQDRDLNLVGKAGMFPGFASWFLYDPVTQTAVAVTTNLETRTMMAMQLAVNIFEQLQHKSLVK